MGAWNAGNFDEETLDWLEEAVFDPLLEFVEENIASEDRLRSRQVVGGIDVLVTLYEKYQEPPPGVRRA